MHARLFAFPAVVAALSIIHAALAQDATQDFNRDLQTGQDVGVTLKNSVSPDGKLGVLFVARKADAKPSDWPKVYANVAVGETAAASGKTFTAENWLVSLADKKRLVQVAGVPTKIAPVYDGWQLREGMAGNGFSVLWGPEQDGSRFGLVNFDGKSGCADIFIVSVDGADAKLASIRGTLQTATRKFIASQRKKGPKAESYAVTYRLLGFSIAEGSGSAPSAARVGFLADPPKDAKAGPLEGVLTVKFSRNPLGMPGVVVANVKAGREEPDANAAIGNHPAPVNASVTGNTDAKTPKSTADFARFRAAIDEKSRTNAWKTATVDLPKSGKGKTVYAKGWADGKALCKLLHVDSNASDDEAVTVFYWLDGKLVSAFKYLKGGYTGDPKLKERTETYNFLDGKGLDFHQDPEIGGDGKSSDSESKAEAVKKEAAEWSAAVLKELGL